jgi:hypothetical protein
MFLIWCNCVPECTRSFQAILSIIWALLFFCFDYQTHCRRIFYRTSWYRLIVEWLYAQGVLVETHCTLIMHRASCCRLVVDWLCTGRLCNDNYRTDSFSNYGHISRVDHCCRRLRCPCKKADPRGIALWPSRAVTLPSTRRVPLTKSTAALLSVKSSKQTRPLPIPPHRFLFIYLFISIFLSGMFYHVLIFESTLTYRFFVC